MKRRTMKKIVIWAASILVVVIVGGYFAINYAANKVMDSLADSILETAITNDAPTQATTSPNISSKQSDPFIASPSAGSGSVTKPIKSNSPQSSGSDEKSKPSSDGKGDLAGNYSAEVSTTKAENVKDSISFSEKTKVMTIMLKKLNADDIKTLSNLSKGGLTVEKKREAKKLILQKLSEKEYDELIRIASKYGLSQGKSYEDSKKETGTE